MIQLIITNFGNFHGKGLTKPLPSGIIIIIIKKKEGRKNVSKSLEKFCKENNLTEMKLIIDK